MFKKTTQGDYINFIGQPMYTHENGYTAILFGMNALAIQKGDKKVASTCTRNVHTETEVMEMLGRIPECVKAMKKVKHYDNDIVANNANKSTLDMYTEQFARNHNISIEEANNHPTVKLLRKMENDLWGG